MIYKYCRTLSRYYTSNLQNHYKRITKYESFQKKIELQMIIKLINDSARFDELISTLLIFDTYLRIHEFDSWSFIVNQRVIAIRKIMNEIQKIQIERQINDALNTRNEFIMNLVHDLSLNPDVLMWRKKNSRHDH